jgi:ribosomal protein S18 acetylase RimI-like enzyme
MLPELRPMHPEDHAAALELWRRTEGMSLNAADTPEQVGRFLRRNPGLSVVAVSGGRIVVTALCGHDGRRGFLYHVAVAAEFRGRGVGKAMVSRCLGALEAEGLTRVHLVVFAANESGRKFWEHLGFVPRRELLLCSRNFA